MVTFRCGKGTNDNPNLAGCVVLYLYHHKQPCSPFFLLPRGSRRQRSQDRERPGLLNKQPRPKTLHSGCSALPSSQSTWRGAGGQNTRFARNGRWFQQATRKIQCSGGDRPGPAPLPLGQNTYSCCLDRPEEEKEAVALEPVGAGINAGCALGGTMFYKNVKTKEHSSGGRPDDGTLCPI